MYICVNTCVNTRLCRYAYILLPHYMYMYMYICMCTFVYMYMIYPITKLARRQYALHSPSHLCNIYDVKYYTIHVHMTVC